MIGEAEFKILEASYSKDVDTETCRFAYTRVDSPTRSKSFRLQWSFKFYSVVWRITYNITVYK